MGAENIQNIARKQTGNSFPDRLELPENPVYRTKTDIFNAWNRNHPVTGERLAKFYRDLKNEKIRQASGLPYTNASINLFLSALKNAIEITFPDFSTIEGKNRLDRFFSRELRYLEVEKSVDESKIFTVEELNVLEEHADRKTWVFIKFLYHSGLRISEALNIRIRDLEQGEKYFTVTVRRGKRGRERKVDLISTKLIEEIRDSFQSREYLFQNHHPTSRNGKYTRQRWFQKISDLATMHFDRKLSPHFLRHSHATALSKTGSPVGAIQKRLGHKSPATTIQSYISAKVKAEEIEKITEGLN